MLNYDEIVSQAQEHRTFLLTNAEHQRLAQALVAAQPHPIVAWIGQQLSQWGRLQGERPTPSLPVGPMAVGHTQ